MATDDKNTPSPIQPAIHTPDEVDGLSSGRDTEIPSIPLTLDDFRTRTGSKPPRPPASPFRG